jgi:uncharacterized DUF497 family protein
MEFEWDDEKAAINLAEHKVSFDEAKTVLMIRSTSISTIPIIPTMNIAT